MNEPSNDNQLMMTNIFQNMKNRNVNSICNIKEVMEFIKSGQFKEEIETARSFGKGHPIFEMIKSTTPTFTPNGTFNEIRKVDHLNGLSGLIYLDIDHPIDTEKLNGIPFIYSYWKSISGKGYGLLVKTEGLTINNFKTSWTYLNDYFLDIGIHIDPNTKDISRQCVISYDPDICINPEVIPLSIKDIPVKSILTSNSNAVSMTYPDFPEWSENSFTGSTHLIYNTTLSDYNDMDYIVIKEGKDYRNSYLPEKIKNGDRHKWMYSYITTLIYNNPAISPETLRKILSTVNKQYCKPPLTTDEIHSMINWTYKKYKNNELIIKTRKKKIWINPDKELSKTDKRSIIGKVSGKLRREQTIDNLISVYKLLSLQYPRVTQKMLEEHSTVKIGTVKKYWKEIKEGILHCKKLEEQTY